MGLDTVELVIEIEETFHIKIDDRDAAQIRTVGELCDYVQARVPLADREGQRGCLSAKAFFRFRRAAMAVTGAARPAIRPATRLSTLVPFIRRRQAWQKIGAAAQLELPALTRPGIILGGLTIVGFFAALFAMIEAMSYGMPFAIIVFLVVAAIYGIAGLVLTRPFATVLPCATVGQLSKVLVVSNIQKFTDDNLGWTRKEIFDTVSMIIVRVWNVQPTLVTREAQIVRDLGLD